MRKPTFKIAIIFLAVFTIITAALSTLVLLINYGKLTSFIEDRINKKTNFDIKIADVHLNVFSGLELKKVNLQDISNQKQFKLECNTITIQYNPIGLLNRDIKTLNLSDVQINLKVERGMGAATSLHAPPHLPSISNITDFYPENLLIEKVSVNNTKIQVTSGKYLLTLSEIDILINEIQPAKPFDITLNGNFSVFDNSKETQSNLHGKIDIKSKFNLPNAELIFLDGSNILVNNPNLNIGKYTFKANSLEIPIKATSFPSDSKSILNVDGKCIVRKGHLQLPNVQLTAIDFPTTFTLDYPNQIKLSSKFTNGNLHYNNVNYTINKLISNIKTNINLKQPESTLLQTQIYTPFSDPVSISSTIDMRNKIIRDTSLKVHDISCKNIAETFKCTIPEKYKEWSLNGNISIDTFIETTINKTDNDKSMNIKTTTDLSLSGLKFASPDYNYFGEGINGHIKMNADTDYDFSKMSFAANCTLEPFLVQLGEFTTDMRNRKTHLSINSNYDIRKKHLIEIEAALSWDSLGTITAKGNVMNLADKPQLDMNIEIKTLSNAAFFETFVKDTVEYSNSELFNSHIDGDSNVSFHIKGPEDNLSVDGLIKINGLNFAYGNTSIEDINVSLPVSIVYPRSRSLIQKADIPDSQYGTIQFRKLSHGPLEIDGIQFNPIIISNNFSIKDSFKIPVFEGTIDIKNLSVENAINHDRKVKLEFQFNNINLKDMSTTYKLTPFEGTLNSSIVSFQQHKQKLFSKDEIRINIFGGDITISDLTLNNYLKSMREIGFSAEVKHLDLGKMSDTYREWGNITGIINGHVKDFKLAAGEPSSFEIEMMTEKRPDIKQIVSTKFLKNFVPGIGKVLDKVGLTNYKYAIMGLRARLENDYIKLQGAVREGEKELFMKGAGMKKLEIVFPNVDRRVPFKTFLNSFKGILSSDIEGTKVQFK
ncbi:MAG: AsmA family protein [Planctomycetota bacterium]